MLIISNTQFESEFGFGLDFRPDFRWTYVNGKEKESRNRDFTPYLVKIYSARSHNDCLYSIENNLIHKTKNRKVKLMKTLKSLVIPGILLAAGLLFMTLAGCGDTGVSVPSDNSQLSLSVKSETGGMDNSSAIVITEAKALIAEIELEKEPSGEKELHIRDPFVIHFNPDGSIKEMGTKEIPNGSYSKIKFQIHKPEDTETPPDPEFKEGASGNLRYSFIIKGTYNGNSFVFKSRKSANLVINFDGVISINGTGINITILYEMLKWFKNGSSEVDPRNPEFENLIDDNIKTSFKLAFKDDDKNGQPDE
jgi:hypothetical protein